jgi:hypothetical protein
MKKTIRIAITAAAAQLLAATSSFASPVTYDLTATLYGGGTVTGDFTVNNGTLTAFDFNLPGGLPDPVASEINLSNTFPSQTFISVSALPQTQIGSYYYDSGNSTYYYTVLNLQLNSLPTDANPTSLGFSSLLQAPLFGSNWDYIGTFQSGTISLDTPVSATPLPATLPLFAGGLAFVGYLARRRKKSGTEALSVA